MFALIPNIRVYYGLLVRFGLKFKNRDRTVNRLKEKKKPDQTIQTVDQTKYLNYGLVGLVYGLDQTLFSPTYNYHYTPKL